MVMGHFSGVAELSFDAVVVLKNAPIWNKFRDFIVDLSGKKNFNLISQNGIHGGRKIREKTVIEIFEV